MKTVLNHGNAELKGTLVSMVLDCLMPLPKSMHQQSKKCTASDTVLCVASPQKVRRLIYARAWNSPPLLANRLIGCIRRDVSWTAVCCQSSPLAEPVPIPGEVVVLAPHSKFPAVCLFSWSRGCGYMLGATG